MRIKTQQTFHMKKNGLIVKKYLFYKIDLNIQIKLKYVKQINNLISIS